MVCGEGAAAAMTWLELDRRAWVPDAQLLGYVPVGDGLLEHYRRSPCFLHVSLTEGMPQVLIEAFASGLPVVATDVGGVRDAVQDAALLIGPADAAAAVAAVRRVAGEPELRAGLIEAGLASAELHTLAGRERPRGRIHRAAQRRRTHSYALGLTRLGAVLACQASHRLASAIRSPRA